MERRVMRVRVRKAIAIGAVLAPLAIFAAHPIAQSRRSMTVRVTETAGIRRTTYPTGIRVNFQQGVLGDASHVRLLAGGNEVPAQFAAESSYSDGSVQWLAIDFNVSIGPKETANYALEYGGDVKPTAAARGLTVVEDAGGIQIGSVRLGLTGAPLLLSVKYRREDIGAGTNGFSVVDAGGKSFDASGAPQPKVQVLKPGPFLAVVQYSGRLPISSDYSVVYVTSVAMPNSKSWVKVTTTIADPEKRLREVSLHTPVTLSAQPWTWDFGTGSWSYGLLRSPAESVTLSQSVGVSQSTKWEILAGPKGAEQRYEVSGGRRPNLAEGWGHIQDQSEAIAFAISGFGAEAGTYSSTLGGNGQLSFRWAPAKPGPTLQLTVYEHFVASPVPVGAVTSPVSMLNPLVVDVSNR